MPGLGATVQRTSSSRILPSRIQRRVDVPVAPLAAIGSALLACPVGQALSETFHVPLSMLSVSLYAPDGVRWELSGRAAGGGVVLGLAVGGGVLGLAVGGGV